MALTYQDVSLDNDTPDRDAKLVFRDGNLLAVLSRLSAMHGELAGHWFIEATFEGPSTPSLPTFETIEHFEQWLASR
jgi:hypothetical protein